MRNITLLEAQALLLSELYNMVSSVVSCELNEAMTPFQKQQQKRRQTLATNTPRPAKQSVFYKHAVRAIFDSLKRSGSSFQGAAKGSQIIAQWMLKKHKYATGQPSGNFSLTSKGHSRNKKHVAEPKNIKDKKAKKYDYIMGIQRKKQQQQQALKQKAASAG